MSLIPSRRQFLSDVVTDQDLDRLHPGAFNILRAPRGWGKTTFMFDDRILKLARDKKNVCYLVHTKVLRDKICAEHPAYCRAFTDKEADGWLAHRTGSMWKLNGFRILIWLSGMNLMIYSNTIIRK